MGRETAAGIAQHKAFLIGADGGAHHLPRNIQKARLESAQKHHRPFHQPRHLMQQGVIFHQLQPMREGQGFGVIQNELAAAGGVENHLRLFK